MVEGGRGSRVGIVEVEASGRRKEDALGFEGVGKEEEVMVEDDAVG